MLPKQLNIWETETIHFPRKFTIEDYIVLSIQEYPYRLIANGTKKLEYRRRFRKAPSIAFVYVSSPVKALNSVILLDTPIFGSARRIADLAEEQVPGNGKSVYEYLKDIDKGCAIPILRFKPIPVISLEELTSRFRFTAPQLYFSLYKKTEFFEYLFNLADLRSIYDPHFD